MTVSLFLQVGLEQMMHQSIRFNFLFNLEDDGKKPKIKRSLKVK